MRQLFAILWAALGVSGLHAAEVPRIVVDDEHLQLQSEAGVSPPYYEIPAGVSLEVDASHYNLQLPEALKGERPNSLQLVLGTDQQFSAEWPASGRKVLLSEKTLSPNPGSRPFGGFQSGQEGVVAIGVLSGPRFSVVWVGMFRVQ